MFKYEFVIPHSRQDSIDIINRFTVPYSFSRLFDNGAFMSRFTAKGFVLIRTPNYVCLKLDGIKYFRCRLYDHEEGCRLVGRFVPPKSLVIFAIIVMAIVISSAVIERNLLFAVSALIMALIWFTATVAVANLPTASKHCLLDLIKYKLNGVPLKEYSEQKKNGTYRRIRKLRCHCCGNYTIDDDTPPIVEICPVCFWQYDEAGHEKPHISIGPNKVSLNEARENYKKYGAVSYEFTGNVREPKHDELPENNI